MTDDRTPAPGSEQVADTDHAIPVPDYARTILVPISNPHTAAALLTIAGSLADIDEGRVVALAVVTDDTTAEQQQEALEELEDLVDSTSWLPGVTFEMVTRSAATVARGILDAGAEYGG
jgi:K+-sensing histidine kinase KdpD